MLSSQGKDKHCFRQKCLLYLQKRQQYRPIHRHRLQHRKHRFHHRSHQSHHRHRHQCRFRLVFHYQLLWRPKNYHSMLRHSLLQNHHFRVQLNRLARGFHRYKCLHRFRGSRIRCFEKQLHWIHLLRLLRQNQGTHCNHHPYNPRGHRYLQRYSGIQVLLHQNHHLQSHHRYKRC